HARTRGRLLEQKAERPARQQRLAHALAPRTFQLDRPVDQGAGLVGGQLEQVGEVAEHRSRSLPGVSSRGPQALGAGSSRITSARIAHPSSIWSSVIFRAGRSRTTVPWVAFT